MTVTDTAVPEGLKVSGRSFWESLNADFDFSDTERVLVIEICRCVDRLDALNDSINTLGPMVEGSQGQQVVNPALTEARGQQAILHRLLGGLQLEDENGETIKSPRQVAATGAANSRWQKRKDT